MKTNKYINEALLETVDNQLRANEPPETKQTYLRLKKMGYNDKDAKLLICQCVLIEIYEVSKNSKPYNEKRFIKNLNKLPEEPFKDQEHDG